MAIKFITGNINKFKEVQEVLPDLEQFVADLPEIQDIDAHKIIRAKLKEAFNHYDGEFIVEDTSLYLDSLNGLPGPFVKWFLQTVGEKGIYDIARSMGNVNATARVLIGYAKSFEEIYFFESELKGEVVPPAGNLDFGWGPIFKPQGFSKTFGQMTREEKSAIGMRHEAARKLRDFLLI